MRLGTKIIYVILDKDAIAKHKLNIFSLADRLAYAGVDMLQFRFTDTCDKIVLATAKKLRKIIHKRKKLFIVNNRPDIVMITEADGLHLGKNDIDANSARSILGKKKIIGKTIHSFKELMLSHKQDIDYLSAGAVFKTKTKPLAKLLGRRCLRKMILHADKPLFAIGGINLTNLSHITAVGIGNIALGEGIILKKNIPNAVKKIKRCLQNLS